MTNRESPSTKNWLTISNRLLASLLGDSELVKKWWHSPNLAFNNLTPLEQWEIDREQVTGYLFDASNK